MRDRKIRPEDHLLASYCLPSDTCMTNGDREGRIFLSHPHTNIMAFFFLHTLKYGKKKKRLLNTLGYNIITSL